MPRYPQLMPYDVSERDFEARVIERSRDLPVVVDFWAEWCGPCRTLGPALEAAVERRAGAVELVKVDTDRNPNLAMAFQIASIPAVKAFRDGRIVAEFTGAIPPARIEQFLDRVVPSAADRLTAAGDEQSLRAALEADPKHAEAARALGRILVERGEADEARPLLERLTGDFLADGLLARLELAGANGHRPDEGFDRALAAWDAGELERALEGLQAALERTDDPERRDLLRRVMVGVLSELDPADPLARAHRRRLAAALT